MIIEWWYGFASVLIVLVAALFEPSRAGCPPGWWLNGIRPSGSFECRPVGMPGGDEDNGNDVGIVPPGRLEGRIYCGAATPIVLPREAVGCLVTRGLPTAPSVPQLEGSGLRATSGAVTLLELAP